MREEVVKKERSSEIFSALLSTFVRAYLFIFLLSNFQPFDTVLPVRAVPSTEFHSIEIIK